MLETENLKRLLKLIKNYPPFMSMGQVIEATSYNKEEVMQRIESGKLTPYEHKGATLFRRSQVWKC